MSLKSRSLVALFVAQAVCVPAWSAVSAEERNLSELRNTVVNLLQSLVERGVFTREQAEALVTAAQEKAAQDADAAAAAQAAQEQADAGAVRVPYVPEIVKEEIRRQVAAELAPEVTRNVIEQAKSEDWGIPGALPDWVTRIRWNGDVRVRGQGDLYGEENPEATFLDIQTINERGGIGPAGLAAFSNVTEDRNRMRVRLRLGLEADLGWGWSLGTRLTTGNLRDPISTNQTLGNTGARYQTGFDLGYVKWYHNSSTGKHVVNAWGGRIPNPWVGTELVWDPDLSFEGAAVNYRFGLLRDDPYGHFAFATLGAFPIQEVELSDDDKWLYGAQLGFEWKFAGGSRARFAASYYQYENIVGQLNAFESNLLDYTAPQWVQRGNSIWDIRNSADRSRNLFALASDYHLANATFTFDWKLSELYRIGFTADYVRNIGFDEDEILERIGRFIEKRNEGYQAEINFGSTTAQRNGWWRGSFGYRYVQRDAVLDAFTDSDFHLGGTNAQGYFVGAEYGFTPRTSLRLRYLSANEIDGEPLSIDVLQLDLNAQF